MRKCSQIFIPDEPVALRVTLQDSLDQRLRRVILPVCLLVELEGRRARLCLDALVYGGLRSSTSASTALLGDGSEVSLALGLVLFDLLCGPQLLYLHLVVGEVCAVKGLKVWEPDGEFGSELLVHGLITEDRIAWILHQVQVLQVWGLLSEGLQHTCIPIQLVVTDGEHFQVQQVWHAIQNFKLIVVQDQLLKIYKGD